MGVVLMKVTLATQTWGLERMEREKTKEESVNRWDELRWKRTEEENWFLKKKWGGKRVRWERKGEYVEVGLLERTIQSNQYCIKAVNAPEHLSHVPQRTHAAGLLNDFVKCHYRAPPRRQIGLQIKRHAVTLTHTHTQVYVHMCGRQLTAAQTFIV